jgi:cyclase
MLRPRLIPCLLVQDGALVKTRQFGAAKYVGDPFNAVRIFNEKAADELLVLDIDATSTGAEPNYSLIKSLASECRMPLAYGGGVRTVEQIERIIALGVEKVAIGAAAVETPGLIETAAKSVGNQSIVGVMDVRRNGSKGYEVFTRRGSIPTGLAPVAFAKQLQSSGAGEILINSVDRDGVMEGYDLELIASVRDEVSTPITALGGAGSLTDIQNLVRTFGTIGAAAGSLFVFKGPFRAVLINYPSRSDLDRMLPGAPAN